MLGRHALRTEQSRSGSLETWSLNPLRFVPDPQPIYMKKALILLTIGTFIGWFLASNMAVDIEDIQDCRDKIVKCE